MPKENVFPKIILLSIDVTSMISRTHFTDNTFSHQDVFLLSHLGHCNILLLGRCHIGYLVSYRHIPWNILVAKTHSFSCWWDTSTWQNRSEKLYNLTLIVFDRAHRIVSKTEGIRQNHTLIHFSPTDMHIFIVGQQDNLNSPRPHCKNLL